MRAILKRDFLSGMRNVTGFLFMALIIFFTALYFFVYNIMNGVPDMSNAMMGATFILIIGVPVLTMRALADERRTRTDQLLLTSPVSVGKIVLGKYFSLLLIFAISMAVVCLFPLVMLTAGTPDLRLSYVSIIAFFFYGAACIAVCLFVSSLTESQVISAVLSAGLLIISYFMPAIISLVSANENILTKALSVFDMSSPIEKTVGGTLELSSFVYYVSVIIFFLFLTVQSIQKRRYQVSIRHIAAGAYSLSAVAVLAAILVFVNLIFGMIPEKYRSFDITSGKLHTLTQDTIDFISGLDQDVNLYVINNEKNKDENVDRTLNQYKELSDHIKVEYVDPTTNPKFTTQYTQDPVYTGSVIVAANDISRVVNADELYQYEANYQTYSYEETGYDAEGQLTSAIQYVTGDDHPTIYELQGHGEAELDSAFRDIIAKANFEMNNVNLVGVDAVPDDCAMLLINGAQNDISEDDAKKIKTYLEGGGNMLVTLSAMVDATPNLNGVLSDYNITTVDGVIIEGDESRIYAQSPLYLLPEIQYDTVTEKVSDGYIFMPYCKGMMTTSTEDVTVTPLLSTTASSFARADIETNDSIDPSESDTMGPFNVGVKAVKGGASDSGNEGAAEGDAAAADSGDASGSTVIVYGCSEVFTTDTDAVVSGYNQGLFAGSLAALVTEETGDLISIPAKSYNTTTLLFSTGTASLWMLGLVVMLPLCLIVVGVVIWSRRRKL